MFVIRCLFGVIFVNTTSNDDLSTAVVTCTTNSATTNTTWSTLNSGETVSVTSNTQLLWKQSTIKQVCLKKGTGNATIN